METTPRRTRMERSRLKVRIRVKDLETVQQDHSNRDRNHFNAIIVGEGSQLSSMSESRGQGNKGGWGEGGSWYYNPDPLCRLIGPKNEVQVVVND